ncbi:hypothetical protein [Paraburkholderia youngii]|uniref:hypothetical protein n=1 Tax=Paraburkholderia youngii TaxID=2782701 RepID=UPI003D24B5A3
MLIDDRVAHSRARLHLSEQAVSLHHHDRRIAEMMSKGLQRVHQQGLSLRTFRRTFGDKLVRELQKAGYTCWYKGDDAETFSLCILANVVDPTNGLRSVTYAFALRTQAMTAACCFRVTHHAIARCLQRNGTMKISDIRTDLRVASGLSWAFMCLAHEQGWQQVAVPTPTGLFLGEYNATDGLVLRTFVRPGENGRVSRWSRVLDAFDGLPPTSDMHNDAAVTGYIDRSNVWLEANSTRIGAKLPFLRQPYVATADPLDRAWRDNAGAELAAA